MDNLTAKTPEPPYWVATFSTVKNKDIEGYGEMAKKMNKMVQKQEGFLGVDSVYDPETGIGITNSYWESEEAILKWKNNPEHQVAQAMGRKKWYKEYNIRVAKVTKAYRF
jgi:heme-degrading monooxygenase HmoA